MQRTSLAFRPKRTLTGGVRVDIISDITDDGTIEKKLTDAPGYDAEATVNWKHKKIVYTSKASGDLDLWTMNENGSGKKRFTFETPDGMVVGELLGENWRSWDFQIVDPSGTEVARVTKKWTGLLREGFTTADRYIFEAQPALNGTLRPLAFAAALAIDTALKQDER